MAVRTLMTFKITYQMAIFDDPIEKYCSQLISVSCSLSLNGYIEYSWWCRWEGLFHYLNR